MKVQIYISKLEYNNQTINFERWSYKKVDTVLEKVIELYKNGKDFAWLYKKDIEKSDCLVIYKTDTNDGKYEEVKRIEKSELLKMCGY